MKKIIFITSGKINFKFPNLTLYESIRETAMGKIFPKLDGTIIDKPDIVFDQIICAPSVQCTETAKYFGKEFKIADELLPLKFDLEKIIPKSEFENLENNGFNVLRQRYLKSFFENKLLEDNREIIKRFNKIVNITPNDGVILAISHAYLIKQFKAYFKLGEEMFTNFEKLSEIFKPEKETMRRLETVEIIIN